MTTDPGDLVLDPTAAAAPRPTSRSNGAGAGSPSTPAASRLPWRGSGCSRRSTIITRSVTRYQGSGTRSDPSRVRVGPIAFVRLRLQNRPPHHPEIHRAEPGARPDLRPVGAGAGREAGRAQRGAGDRHTGPTCQAPGEAGRQGAPGGQERDHGGRPAAVAAAVRSGQRQVRGRSGSLARVGSPLRHRPRLARTAASRADGLPASLARQDGRGEPDHRGQRGPGRAGGSAQGHARRAARQRAVHGGGGPAGRGVARSGKPHRRRAGGVGDLRGFRKPRRSGAENRPTPRRTWTR